MPLVPFGCTATPVACRFAVQESTTFACVHAGQGWFSQGRSRCGTLERVRSFRSSTRRAAAGRACADQSVRVKTSSEGAPRARVRFEFS